MKEIFVNLIVFQLTTSEWFQTKVVVNVDSSGKRKFTSVFFLAFFLMYLAVHSMCK
jgi:hypothetical protein